MTGRHAQRRILHVWLPFLATDRIDRLRRPDDPARHRTVPFVTVERHGGNMQIVAVDACAAREGLQPGLALAQARARFPGLLVAEAERSADARALIDLARAAGRYTPFVGVDPPSGLFLDVTGCAHLFGGEAGLLDDLLGRFARWGFAARAAITDDPATAWGVARHGGGGVVPPGGGEAALEPLPVAALRLPEETVSALERLGLKTVHLVLQQPRKAIVRRFGAELARRIDQIRGLRSEPITPLSHVPPLVFERRFADPAMQSEAVLMSLGSLAERLCHALEQRGEGARRVRATLFHADGAVLEAEAGTSRPLADPKRLVEVLKPRLEAVWERVQGDSGVDLVRLAADESEPLDVRQETLDERQDAHTDLARLVDILSARLGEDAVQRIVPNDSHQPGEAERLVPAREALVPAPWRSEQADRPAPLPQSAGAAPMRPLKIFEPPEPVETLAGVPDGPPVRFVWRRVTHHVAVAEGPERIAPSWWDLPAGEGLTFDYYRVEDVRGRRFWMFRRGLYGRETSEPQWYVHGVFA